MDFLTSGKISIMQCDAHAEDNVKMLAKAYWNSEDDINFAVESVDRSLRIGSVKQYYLDNIMFQHQVEYVFEDCHGRLYNKFEDIPVYDVFYRTGYRWKRTREMPMNDNWCIFRGNEIACIKASEFRIGVFNAEPVNRGVQL